MGTFSLSSSSYAGVTVATEGGGGGGRGRRRRRPETEKGNPKLGHVSTQPPFSLLSFPPPMVVWSSYSFPPLSSLAIRLLLSPPSLFECEYVPSHFPPLASIPAEQKHCISLSCTVQDSESVWNIFRSRSYRRLFR